MANGAIPKRKRSGKYRFVDVSKIRGTTEYELLKELIAAFESAERDGYDLRAMNAYVAVFYQPAEGK